MKTIQDLEKEQDKMSIFRDFEQLKQYVVTVKDLLDAMSLLTDDEKLEVIKLDYFQRQSTFTKSRAVMRIKDEAVKSQIIHDLPLMEAVFDKYNFIQFLGTVSEEDKMYVLSTSDILKKFDVKKYEIKKIINTMSKESCTKILLNKELMEQFNFNSFEIKDLIISGIDNDDLKLELAKKYDLKKHEIFEIIKSFSDEKKINIILENKQGLGNDNILDLISSLEIDSTIDFINNQQEFLQKNNIKPFQLIKRMPAEKQLQLIPRIDEIQVSEAEKRRIFASLQNEAKEQIDLAQIDEKYRKLIEMQLSTEFSNYGKIVLKLDEDLSQYEDLDELISINPLQMVKSDEDLQQLLKLCQICPELTVKDNIILGNSSGKEYVQGEEWVSSVLQAIQPEWTEVQKLAYIDTAIGKRVSYTPNFGTEAERSGDARALWKIITNGYGVCNGIAQVEQYLLGRVGIESELISSGSHSFVKVKNIQIPTEDGIVQGDTLVDPTWNLTASRYGSRPHHFCKSYEELRKVDIDANGVDHECHRNEELEKSVTINMDIQRLREVYRSIGVAGKDGSFPIGQLIEQARKIDETSTDMQMNISSKFALLRK